MSWIDIIYILSLLLYICATSCAIAAMLGRSFKLNRLALALTLAGFGIHTLLLIGSVISDHAIFASRTVYLIPLAWCLVAVGLVMGWKLKANMLMFFTPPLASILLILALWMHSAGFISKHLSGPIFYLHIISIFIGIGLIVVAAGGGVVFLWQEHSIKSKTPLARFRKDLPTLMALDKINALAALIGFPAYSLGVICGFIWARIVWGSFFSGDAKEFVSIAIWVLYAILFNLRQVHGWRGRKPAILALTIFTASLFSLFFVNTLFSSHHSFEPVL